MRKFLTVRRGLLMAIAAVFLLALSPVLSPGALAQQPGSLDKILRDKKVRVGWIASAPQMMKDSASGQLRGYFVDSIRHIFKEIDVEPEFVETSFSTFVAALQTNQLDLCIASTFITIKRAAVLDYTRPILYIGFSAIVRSDEARYKSLEDLNKPGTKIAVLLGGASQNYVKLNMPKAEVITLDTTNQSAPFLEVVSKRADVGLNDAWAVRRFAANQPGVKDLFGTSPYNVQPMAWTVRKGNQDMLNFLNSSIETMLVSGKLEEFANAYDASGRYKQVIQLTPFAGK